MNQKSPIPMSSPDITRAEVKAVCRSPEDSLSQHRATYQGLRRGLCAEYVGARHAVGVNSGTSGLHLAVIAAGVQEGDLVITTPFSFIASANCILYERAIPVFVDVDPVPATSIPALVAEAAEQTWRGGRRSPALAAAGLAAAGSRGARESARCPSTPSASRRTWIPIVAVARRAWPGGDRGCLRGDRRRVQRPSGRHAGRCGCFRLLPQQTDDHRRGRDDRHRSRGLGRSFP